jgi:hypothetical protein
MRRRAACTLAVFATLFGCKRIPGPGDECKPTDIRCVDPKTELACQHGVFIAAPCKGPLGCREDGKRLVCDFSGNATGDPCSTEDEGNARCVGEDQRITCLGGKYFVDYCRGPEQCKSTGTSLKCDQTKAQEGDPCRGKSNSCSTDGKRVLTCHDDRFVTTAHCDGESGCSVSQGEINCDLGKKEENPKSKKGR